MFESFNIDYLKQKIIEIPSGCYDNPDSVTQGFIIESRIHSYIKSCFYCVTILNESSLSKIVFMHYNAGS